MKKLKWIGAGALAFGIQQASATTLQIELTQVHLKYNGTTIYDSGNILVGLSKSTSLVGVSASATYSIDDNTVGIELNPITHPLSVDIKLTPSGPISNGGSTALNAGGNVNFERSGAFGLQLGNDAGGSVMVTSGIRFDAIGGTTTLGFQSLPFGFVFDPNLPLTYSYSSSQATVHVLNGIVKDFDSTGSLTITQIVPEGGSTAMLLGAGLLGVGILARRKSLNVA